MRTLLLLGVLLSTPPLTAQDTSAIATGPVRFVTWPETRTLGTALARATAAAPAFAGMPADVLARGGDVVVYVVPDETRFRERTRGMAPDWGAGVAFPHEGVIVLPGYTSERGGAQDLRRVLRHELAHIALQRRLGDAQVPRWFTEGYAVWSARQLDTDAAWLLRLAFVLDRAPALDSLELRWPGGATDARVAYLLSATAVEYLYSLGTPAQFERLLETWASAGSLEPALRATYVVSGAQFERLWRREVRARYGWLLFLTQGVVAALFLTLLVLVLFWIRRRRDRRKLALLQAAEPPDAPAYWLEPEPGPDPEEAGEETRSP